MKKAPIAQKRIRRHFTEEQLVDRHALAVLARYPTADIFNIPFASPTQVESKFATDQHSYTGMTFITSKGRIRHTFENVDG